MTHIDPYKKFIDKYKKTGYISANSAKLLSQAGIGKDNFLKIKNRISQCYRFLNNQDIDLLEDLLIYAKDDFNAENLFVWFSLIIESKSLLSTFEFNVSKDDRGITSKAFRILNDESDTLCEIISIIGDKLKSEVDRNKQRVEEYKIRRPGARDYGLNYRMVYLSRNNIFERVIINPQINIQFDLNFNDNFDYTDNTIYQANKQIRWDKLEKFKTYLKEEIMDRYFKMLGMNNSFYITYSSMSSLFSDAVYKISYSL